MNSKRKGARGERSFRDLLRAAGFAARRSQQYSGAGPDSGDIQCESLARLHFEVKFTERLNLREAFGQARRDARTKIPVLAHRSNRSEWLVTLRGEDFLEIINRSDLVKV